MVCGHLAHVESWLYGALNGQNLRHHSKIIMGCVRLVARQIIGLNKNNEPENPSPFVIGQSTLINNCDS